MASARAQSSNSRHSPWARRTLGPLSPRSLALLLLAALPPLLWFSVHHGSTRALAQASPLQGLAHLLGSGPGLPGTLQQIFELRLWRALTAAGVGAALALSGAYIQGLFRNRLAAPSILGMTGGASLGATLAILAVAGYSPALLLDATEISGSVLVPLCAFLGALATAFLVQRLATVQSHLSIPTLLLTGIALNTVIAGLLALVLSWAVTEDLEVSRAILRWSFGTLDGAAASGVALVWGGLALALCLAPFLAWELDLLQAGEADARSLGVPTARVKNMALSAAALAAACAVAVAGQIAFLGLVIPHLVRLVAGGSHRTLLYLSPLAGALFLLGTDTLQRWLLADEALAPGVLMSLIGGPFFLLLLWTRRRELESW
ncbi:MAG: iron ABC transporter permease [Planctomycetota bacterium]|jgi:iron complex transport system permease protein|nr:iron ABC transporter permease [Planctomycetota bacterium]MDP6518616.1 iron ABC transporter permease [Planctomycetota bacterium]